MRPYLSTCTLDANSGTTFNLDAARVYTRLHRKPLIRSLWRRSSVLRACHFTHQNHYLNCSRHTIPLKQDFFLQNYKILTLAPGFTLYEKHLVLLAPVYSWISSSAEPSTLASLVTTDLTFSPGHLYSMWNS